LLVLLTMILFLAIRQFTIAKVSFRRLNFCLVYEMVSTPTQFALPPWCMNDYRRFSSRIPYTHSRPCRIHICRQATHREWANEWMDATMRAVRNRRLTIDLHIVLCQPVVIGFNIVRRITVRRQMFGCKTFWQLGHKTLWWTRHTAHLRSRMCIFISVRRQSDPVNTRLAAHAAL